MKVKKSHFDLSHERKLTCKSDGTLYPILCENLLPGDKFKSSSEILARMVPLTYPVYHKFDVFTHFFFVPYRLLWDGWQDFISPEFTGDQAPEAVFPCFKIRPDSLAGDYAAPVSLFEPGSLADHFGLQLDHFGDSLPLANVTTEAFSSLPFRAYRVIWNEYFRDVDLQDKLDVTKGGGFSYAAENAQFELLRRCWEKDYFTSCRPYAQKGKPVRVEVKPPNYETAILYNSGKSTIVPQPSRAELNIGHLQINPLSDEIQSSGPNDRDSADGVSIDAQNSFTIRDLRYANTMQQFLEKIMRNGSRYIDTLKSIFGVTVPDSRLQRPEFLGGGRQPFVISEVLQTSETVDSALGTFAGHAITNGSHNWEYFAPEHGVVIGLLSIMPRSGYAHVTRRWLSYKDRFEFPTPDFAHLGEQEVFNYEINGQFTDSDKPMDVFGYQDRFGECKNIPSTVHGQFRIDPALVRFHAARLGTGYNLNADFLQISNSDFVERIFAITDYDPFLVAIQHNISALRPLPRRAIPRL